MRRALIVLAIVFAVLAYLAARASWTLHSSESAFLAFILIAITAGLFVGTLVASSGRLRDLLVVRAVRVWLNRARAWTDTNERDLKP